MCLKENLKIIIEAASQFWWIQNNGSTIVGLGREESGADFLEGLGWSWQNTVEINITDRSKEIYLNVVYMYVCRKKALDDLYHLDYMRHS